MAKGVDAVTRKKNKARRKKLEKENSSVSARVASIIAAKKRRQSGKRRMCQVTNFIQYGVCLMQKHGSFVARNKGRLGLNVLF